MEGMGFYGFRSVKEAGNRCCSVLLMGRVALAPFVYALARPLPSPLERSRDLLRRCGVPEARALGTRPLTCSV